VCVCCAQCVGGSTHGSFSLAKGMVVNISRPCRQITTASGISIILNTNSCRLGNVLTFLPSPFLAIYRILICSPSIPPLRGAVDLQTAVSQYGTEFQDQGGDVTALAPQSGFTSHDAKHLQELVASAMTQPDHTITTGPNPVESDQPSSELISLRRTAV
jgi:hypothetical protein